MLLETFGMMEAPAQKHLNKSVYLDIYRVIVLALTVHSEVSLKG